MVIKFDGSPSKFISLILTGYNLTNWSSLLLFSYNFRKNINIDGIYFDASIVNHKFIRFHSPSYIPAMVVYSYTLYLANHYLDNSMPMYSTGAVQQVAMWL